MADPMRNGVTLDHTAVTRLCGLQTARSLSITATLLAAILSAATAGAADLSVAIDLPGGSGKVTEIDQAARRVVLEPTPHTGRGWNCWWYVRLSGVTPGETLTLTVGPSPWATPEQAAFSTDGGKTWQQTAKGKRSGKQITYQQKVDAGEVLFAWGPPFGLDDAASLVKEIAAKIDDKDGVRAEVFELCKSREGRGTPALKLTPPPAADGRKHRGLFLCARQHAWESGSSWVGRGFLEYLASDEPSAVALRKTSIVYFVPVMDVDNVAVGAGGKNQDPHDHNRDWTDKPVFPAVAAAQALIRQMNEAGTFDVYVDLHNPAANDLKPFFFVSEQDQMGPAGQANLKRFVEHATRHITTPMALNPKTRASGPSYDKAWKAISKNWVNSNCRDGVVAVTLETSWNTPASTIDGYRAVGGQLGRSIAEYLASSNAASPKAAETKEPGHQTGHRFFFRNTHMNRRTFLSVTAGLAGAMLAGRPDQSTAAAEAAEPANGPHLATNVYPWGTFAKRVGKTFDPASAEGWADVARAGFDGIETSGAPANLATLIAGSKLGLRSIYVNSTLHDPGRSADSIRQVLAAADAAKPHGCRIIVTNPEPIRWGGAENKTDDQLAHQARSLNTLGLALRERGMTLAYHNHDIELRLAAREFHHMLAGTDAEAVKFCLDAHWVYRGAGNSQVALFDAVRLYGKRVVELHLRQSKYGVWTEVFGAGDIDYARLAAELGAMGVKPHLVLEQAVEKGSPQTLDAVEAHRHSIAYAKQVFRGF